MKISALYTCTFTYEKVFEANSMAEAQAPYGPMQEEFFNPESGTAKRRKEVFDTIKLDHEGEFDGATWHNVTRSIHDETAILDVQEPFMVKKI